MIENVRKTKEEFKALLLSKPNVQSVGIGKKNGNGEIAIIVSVDKKLDEVALPPEAVIPRSVNGVKTDVVESGAIKAFGFTNKVRPVEPGNSCGHYSITAGTLGCLVVHKGEILALSNNHVLAASNAGMQGDPVYQPGSHDGGGPGDAMGSLFKYQPIEMLNAECKVANGLANSLNLVAGLVGSSHRMQARQETSNYVDAALSTLNVKFVPEVRELGMPTGETACTLGDLVQKSGRTTEYTTGVVSQVHTTVRVGYGTGRKALFEDQLVISAKNCKHFSQPGDSGSAVFDMQNRIVGLLFAGSDTVTIVNNWSHVKSLLDIELLV